MITEGRSDGLALPASVSTEGCHPPRSGAVRARGDSSTWGLAEEEQTKQKMELNTLLPLQIGDWASNIRTA